ncbi:MAG: glycosyltransferase family 2 protein [Pseudomonadales bacterium]|nr:glycosyltransferase family 2 protein [Pseudomonadales bacterium]
MNKLSFCVIIPTYNAGDSFDLFLDALNQQNINKQQVLFIDSSSTDSTLNKIQKNHYPVKVIPQHEFNHGKTRQLGIDHFTTTDIAVFLTQDAILDDKDSIKKLIEPFTKDASLAAVCGRQIPHNNATPLSAHARFFNYPEESYIRSKVDIQKLGLKSAFMSNSFAAYQISALKQIGGFPCDTILCEDMFVTAKMILEGFKIFYCGSAVVQHSHNYTFTEEFKRYFDIGVFHSMQPWIQKSLGKAGNAGKTYLKSEIIFIIKQNPIYLLHFILNNFAKILGYKLGKVHKVLPYIIIKKLSMHQQFWNNNQSFK